MFNALLKTQGKSLTKRPSITKRKNKTNIPIVDGTERPTKKGRKNENKKIIARKLKKKMNKTKETERTIVSPSNAQIWIVTKYEI